MYKIKIGKVCTPPNNLWDKILAKERRGYHYVLHKHTLLAFIYKFHIKSTLQTRLWFLTSKDIIELSELSLPKSKSVLNFEQTVLFFFLLLLSLLDNGVVHSTKHGRCNDGIGIGIMYGSISV